MKRKGKITMIDYTSGKGTIIDANLQDIDFIIDKAHQQLRTGMTVSFLITESVYGLIATGLEPLK